jgi:leukotriene-A4 hydrolase
MSKPLSPVDDLIEELKKNPVDPNSFARPDLCRVTNIAWNAQVDFDKQIINGFVDLTYEKQNDSVKEIFLDTSNLTITHVVDRDSKNTLKWHLSEPVKVFGSKLTITLFNTPSKTSVLRINYKTSSSASALQWLTPEQTAGKKRPYLFSQCEAIHCRSMLPCQDTPAVKTPYTARVIFYYNFQAFISCFILFNLFSTNRFVPPKT